MAESPTQSNNFSCTQCSAEISPRSLQTNICPHCGFVFTEHQAQEQSSDNRSASISSSDHNRAPLEDTGRQLILTGHNPTMSMTSTEILRPAAMTTLLWPRHWALQQWERRWARPTVHGLFQPLGLTSSIIYSIRMGQMVILYFNPMNLFSGGFGAIFRQFEEAVPTPANTEIVQSLPTISITEEHVGAGLECPVCKEDYRIEESVRQLPCSHFFHNDCILPWLERRNTCPVCRRSVNEQQVATVQPRLSEVDLFPSSSSSSSSSSTTSSSSPSNENTASN